MAREMGPMATTMERATPRRAERRPSVHLFAIDTSLLAPALVIGGVLLWRRTPAGFAAGATMTVMGAMYPLNLLAAGGFQGAAGVSGAKAFPPEGVGLAVGFLVATLVLLGRRRPVVGG